MTDLYPRDAALLRREKFIDGQWRAAADGRRFEVVDPATGARIAELADSGAPEARAAVLAADAAFGAWRQRPAVARAQLLKRWHAQLVAHQDDLARLISLEQGKPLRESRAEVAYGAGYVEWFAEEARRIDGELIASPERGRQLVVKREPVGIVVAITPWNFPMAMLARKLAPALAAGCTIVAKPAEDTPLTALAITYLAEQAGLPAGVLNLVTASKSRAAEVVDVWLDDPRVRKLSFTGSTAVGRHLATRSADTLKRVSLELGGNAPLIVFDDADLELAVQGAITAKFRNSGQTCIAANRVLVHTAIYDAFAERLVAAVKALRCGPATDEESQIGPLINAAALDKVQRHVRDAVANGATSLIGGQSLAEGGLFYPPTVLRDAHPDMLLAREETFGPVAPLFRFTDEREALRLANDTASGLAAYLYTRDLARAWRVADALEVGMVGINEASISTEIAPFGGIKDSGYGREGSRHGLDEYLQYKYLAIGGLDAAVSAAVRH